MIKNKNWLAIIILMFFVTATTASPSNAAGIWAKVSGRVVGSSIRFKGWVNLSILTRKGKVTGNLNDRTECGGTAWISLSISHGGGKLKCDNGLSAKFKFKLSSRFPIRGKGSGRLADGRKLLLKISPGE